MSSPRRPSSPRGRTAPGRLPASVYWRRRVFVLTLAGALVFVIASLLTGGSDAKSGERPAARQVDAQVRTSPSPTPGAATTTATATATVGPHGKKVVVPTPTPTLAAPEGPCDPADVVVTPTPAKGSVAGSDVIIGLSLTTVTSEACTWQVSPKSITVSVTHRGEEVWTTRHCAKLVPTQDVVVRRAVPTPVAVTWKSARESEPGCHQGNWAFAGSYVVAAAALGGEPVQTDFALGAPARPTVTITPKPKPSPTHKLPKTPRN